MPSDLFNSIGGNDTNVPANQDPRSVAMSRMKEMGISVPEGMENNPQALLQHVLSSGKVPQNRLGMAQQMMQRLFRR